MNEEKEKYTCRRKSPRGDDPISIKHSGGSGGHRRALFHGQTWHEDSADAIRKTAEDCKPVFTQAAVPTPLCTHASAAVQLQSPHRGRNRGSVRAWYIHVHVCVVCVYVRANLYLFLCVSHMHVKLSRLQ